MILTSSSNKVIAFWVIEPCSLDVVDGRFRGSYCLHNPENGGSIHLSNVGLRQLDYSELYHRERHIQLHL
jgi:hypothetical protein